MNVGTLLYVKIWLIAYGIKHQDNPEYVLTRAYVDRKLKMLRKAFVLPNSLLYSLLLLSQFPVFDINLPTRQDYITQRFLISRRLIPIMPIVLFDDIKTGIKWVISYDTGRITDSNCYFLSCYPSDAKNIRKYQREYVNLTREKIPWMTIWECLSRVFEKNTSMEL